ncbi:MAG: calcium/sodium antiporter [Candidatus Cryptobacteroides sp.]
MAIQFLILAAGLLLILLGANWLVEGSSDIARKSGISEFVIGLTIVGIGTSTPEMVVSFLSSFQGNSDMAVGNIIGSNIFNTMLILGATALISPLVITKSNIRRDIPMNIIVTVLLVLLGMKGSIFGFGTNSLNRVDGAILLGLFAWYLYKSFKSNSGEQQDDDAQVKNRPVWLSVVLVLIGLGSLVGGGKLFVSSASELAKLFGVSDKFIAITVMAGGTSLPELATCVVAAFKGKGQLALGNILGSNISNILLILGGSALISPLSFSGMTMVDLGVVTGSSLFILLSAFLFRKQMLDRVEGAILLIAEAGYMWYLLANL